MVESYKIVGDTHELFSVEDPWLFNLSKRDQQRTGCSGFKEKLENTKQNFSDHFVKYIVIQRKTVSFYLHR